MALFAALCAVVRVDIARAEPASCARETDRFAIVPFRLFHHFLVEHVSLQHAAASVAAPSFCPSPLALDAVFFLVMEGSYIFDLSARRAAVARRAAYIPVPRCISCLFPLRCWKLTLW